MLERIGATGLALALTLGAAATSCKGSPPAAPPPALQLIRPAPLTVRGLHFRAGERVTLVVSSGAESSRHVAIATDAGVFVVSLPDVRVDLCSGYTIRATGEAGSAAVLSAPARGCPPAPSFPSASTTATSTRLQVRW